MTAVRELDRATCEVEFAKNRNGKSLLPRVQKNFLVGNEFTKFLKEDEARHKEIMKKADFLAECGSVILCSLAAVSTASSVKEFFIESSQPQCRASISGDLGSA